MTPKTRDSLLLTTIACLQQEIRHEKALVKELETQLRDVNASRRASEEEAQTLMVENGKLRSACDAAKRLIPRETDRENFDRHFAIAFATVAK